MEVQNTFPGELEWINGPEDLGYFSLSFQAKGPEGLARLGFGAYRFKDPDSIHFPEAELEDASTRDLRPAQQWLEQCLEGHILCNQPGLHPSALPRRLIQLREETGGLQARLIESRVFPRPCPYVTLSHCWGPSPLYSLKSHLLEELASDIPLPNLPRTYRDAFEVAVRLGFTLIWIDSLCIIQDSASDLEDESSRMADIYGNASFNIAATASASSKGGLFVQEEPDVPWPHVVSIDIQIGRRFLRGDYTLVSHYFWSSNVDRSPLNTRAWVLQERFFSPRILHFGRDRLYWECQDLLASESFASGQPAFEFKSEARQWGYTPFRKLMRVNLGSRPHLQSVIRRAWYETVQNYTKSELTYQSDKLVAIAGIAKTFQSVLDDVCIAGLWKRTLIMDLLWCRAGAESTGLHRAFDRAPSWSWACLDCAITFPTWALEVPTVMATMESVEVRGSVTHQSGTLRL
ncbi:HET-domain-containing protein [Lophiostoma macrostomum CBS 122681]|uniref:HET-domain-containing protein n=1 Tax=Lophiostoma macrostomum CBS 122681 TaxID=1314788 RepID=A0A6A6STD2_9PLEO|nr:HET-domain-containing protein [Lophiostoma macrostomum CBS 122681]